VGWTFFTGRWLSTSGCRPVPVTSGA